MPTTLVRDGKLAEPTRGRRLSGGRHLSFITDFVPERGDLLYGLRDTRTEYVAAWQATLNDVNDKTKMDRLVAFLTPAPSGGKANWNIIDNFNDHFFLGGAVDFGPEGSANKGLAQFYARMHAIQKTLEQADKTKQAEQINQRAAYKNALPHRPLY